MYLLMITTSWDILQDTFSSETKWNELWESPWVGCAHVMGVSFLSQTEMERCVPLCGVRMPMRWNDVYPYEGWRCPCDGCIILLYVESWDDVVLQMILLSSMSLWLSTGGRAPNGWALVGVWDPLLYCLRVRFTCNPNCDVKGTGRLHHMWKIINVYCNN